METLATVKTKILAGQVVGLQKDIRRIVGPESSGVEGQQIIRACSRFVYENRDLEEDQFLAVVDIINICCELHHHHLSADPFFHLRSMFYVFQRCVRRKEFYHHLTGLAGITEHFIEICDASNEETQSILKQFHQMLWNASISSCAPLEALTLQRYALQCCLANSSSSSNSFISYACEQAASAHSVYQSKEEKSAENSEKYFEAIFKYLLSTLSKQLACDEGCVLPIVRLVIEYAKVMVRTGKITAFRHNNKQIVQLLEAHCDPKMVMGLKGGLKLMEMAILLSLGKGDQDFFLKLLGSCGHVKTLPGPNTVLILCLITTINMLHEHLLSNLKLSSYLMQFLMKRSKTLITEDIAKEVSSVLQQQLTAFFNITSTKSENQGEVFAHILSWGDATCDFCRMHSIGQQDKVLDLYNFGALFGNFGTQAFRQEDLTSSAKFLELAVNLFEQYCLQASDEQKQNASSFLGKRLQLWCDSLRYSGHYWEGGVAASRGFLMGHISPDDLVLVWVKCKRDAEKKGSKALKGMTVCDVVNEAQLKYGEAKGIVFDPAEALLLEIKYYKQQSYNTLEDQLCCGLALMSRGSSSGMERHVLGMLAVVEALWTDPNLASDLHESSSIVHKAKAVLQEAKAGGCRHPVLLELEALTHFWEYLCYISVLYFKADAKVTELKQASLLKPKVTAPGEEYQPHDTCDERPTALLSLRTQHTSLAPLQEALDIWDKFDTQNLPLKNPRTACASLISVGYIYNLSGLVTPTLQAWGLLISLARTHSLHDYLIKGITELVLVAPQLVDSDLVEELQRVVSSLSSNTPAQAQDTKHACLLLSASIATAFYYYWVERYDEGARIVEKALTSEILSMRTVKTTEVHALVHMVASLYAWLPPSLLHTPPSLTAPCFTLAYLSCRQASALILTPPTDISNENICWRHRIVSLLFASIAWLGHLSIATGQPRMARLFLEKSLQLSQKLILPLRIAEFLELLARVDMLCERLKDCSVKVDTLHTLLKAHPLPQEDLENLAPELSKLAITKPPKGRNKKSQVLEIFRDPVLRDGERTHHTECGGGQQEFSMDWDVPFFLTVPHEENAWSPGSEHLERFTTIRFASCPEGVVHCALCTSPVIYRLRISTLVLLSLFYAHGKRFQSARKCLEQAQTIYSEITEKADAVAAHMISLLKRKASSGVKDPSMFVHSRLNLVRLQTRHAQAECLGMEGKWEKALSTSVESLQILVSLNSQLLVQDVHCAVMLSLQAQDLQKMSARCIKSLEDDDQPLVIEQDEFSDKKCATAVTPTNMKTRKTDGSIRRTVQQHLKTPKPAKVNKLVFDIYSDEEEEEKEKGPEEIKPHRFATPQHPVSHTPSTKFFKSEQKRPPSSIKKREKIVTQKGLDSLYDDWGDGVLPAIVLNVPDDPMLLLTNTPGAHTHAPSQVNSITSTTVTTSPPQSESKNKSKTRPGTRTARGTTTTTTTRGRTTRSTTTTTTTTTTTSEGIKTEGDDEPQTQASTEGRARGRPIRRAYGSASTSKAKVTDVPQTTTTSRTRAARSLRLI